MNTIDESTRQQAAYYAQTYRSIAHVAGEPADGVQYCVRCGRELQRAVSLRECAQILASKPHDDWWFRPGVLVFQTIKLSNGRTLGYGADQRGRDPEGELLPDEVRCDVQEAGLVQ